MPTPGNRKQRHVLDIDDVVRDGFMTRENAAALIRGLNGSGGAVKLSVPMGGTNNSVFTDQELLKYDAATGKIVSAGITSVGAGGTTAAPWETGALFSNSGLDTAITSLSDIAIVDQTFSLPASSRWSEVEMSYGFKLAAGGTVTNLRLLLQTSIIPSGEIMQPSASLIYAADVSPDTVGYTWLAKGTVPSEFQASATLRVRLFGRPSDLPTQRTIITRLSYRGAPT